VWPPKIQPDPMALLTESEVRSAARRTHERLSESYGRVLAKAANTTEERFDIFLSHSIRDAEIVRGAHILLKRLGYSVYVDWIVDRDLDREAVSPATALQLKRRMRQCESLLYLATKNTSDSKWMPWELGFFDGYGDGRVAILLVFEGQRHEYEGQEYLGVYPYVDVRLVRGTQGRAMYVSRSSHRYGSFNDWLRDGNSAIRERYQL
jgi:hypothetical protein